ncbi:unnamed protein product [Fraxinus pennsylvanica]|uniref:Crossover junction endonuclease MUS81 n=1 Tax=Fraxinus pennsylvanica TaxID=56036 RepID=A0AAD2DUZ9_9LAMI|nr:unnamed protein product [Fraxinus pennsylvanica]
MDRQKQVSCPENAELAAYMWNKRQEMAQRTQGISDNIDSTLNKAYSNVCSFSAPIKSLKDLSQIKGVGKWILKQMQGFFGTDSRVSKNEDMTGKGNYKNKEPKRYVPQKKSVAYALLITLYRGTENGNEFMRKQELIDAADISGLARVPIAPEKTKGKSGYSGSSPGTWYSGWNCMKTLITKGLVVKSSCPAKYMLTEEGKEVACECLLRSEMLDPNKNLDSLNDVSDLDQRDKSIVDSTVVMSDLGLDNDASFKKMALPSAGLKKQKKSIDIPSEYLDKFVRMGFSEQQIFRAFAEVSEISRSKEMSSIWPTVLCRLREDEVYGQVCLSARENRLMNASPIVASNNQKLAVLRDPGKGFCTLKACSSADCVMEKQGIQGSESKQNVLAMPPLKFGEKFDDVYGVILILDSREQFATQGSRSRKIIEKVCAEFKIQIEVRRLPVGDGIWIARHKYDGSEYVLDFIVERKNVDDLRLSIRDNRYRDQKLRLLRCGFKKMTYLVEGDPNSSEAAESIKTACFTTEILEGFDVQRTSGLADTLRKYGYLTKSIDEYYSSLDAEQRSPGLCPAFDVFIKSCEDLDKMTVTDVFAVQLMQVPHVTETIALAVLDMYPTLISLARAYSLLDGDVSAQEEMLKRQSNNLISGPASRNIFQLVWGK